MFYLLYIIYYTLYILIIYILGIFYEIPSFSVCTLHKTLNFIRNYIQVTIYIYNYNNIQALILDNVIQNLQMRVYDVAYMLLRIITRAS